MKNKHYIILLAVMVLLSCYEDFNTIQLEDDVNASALVQDFNVQYLMLSKYYNSISYDQYLNGLSILSSTSSSNIEMLLNNNPIVRSTTTAEGEIPPFPEYDEVSDVCSPECYELSYALVRIDPYQFETLKDFVNAVRSNLLNSSLDKNSDEYKTLSNIVDNSLGLLIIREYIYNYFNDILSSEFAETRGWWNRWGRCAAGILGSAIGGGLVGAGTGSIIPGLGTLAGGIIGGIGGGLTGAAVACPESESTQQSDCITIEKEFGFDGETVIDIVVTLTPNDYARIDDDGNITEESSQEAKIFSVKDLIYSYYE